jgi:hypothetical protein
MVQLTDAEARALVEAGRTRRRAGVEAITARAREAEAELHYRETVERIAEAHDFNAETPMRFNDVAKTLTPVES